MTKPARLWVIEFTTKRGKPYKRRRFYGGNFWESPEIPEQSRCADERLVEFVEAVKP